MSGSGGRFRQEKLFEEENFFGGNHVSITRVARAGDLLTHAFSYNDERTFRVDGEVVVLRVGEEHKRVKLGIEELRDLATEFFRLRQDPAYTEIVLSVKGGTFGERQVVVPEKAFERVERALAPFRRAPQAAVGAYR